MIGSRDVSDPPPPMHADGRSQRRGVHVRPRQPSDLAPLEQVLAAQRPHTDYPQTWPLPFPIAQFLARPSELAAWVAVGEGGALLGHVSVTRVATAREAASGADEESPEVAGWVSGTGRRIDELAAVSVLFVDHTSAGQGVGSALLETATTFIRGQGLTPVLDVVRESTSAVQLYLHRGWQVIGEARPWWLPDDHQSVLLMTHPAP